jgi:MerR HTH family regulatory protein
MLGVRTATIARWARDGLLKSPVLTPGGHRRYRRADVRAAQQVTGTSEEPDPEQQRMTQDAVRLYDGDRGSGEPGMTTCVRGSGGEPESGRDDDVAS